MDEDAKISQFTGITGASADRAKFFLSSSGGDVETAIATFFESGDVGADEATSTAETGGPATESGAPTTPAPATAPAAAAAPSSGPRTLSGAPAEPLPPGWGSSASSSSARRPPGGAGGFSSGGGIRTFRDLAGSDDGPRGRGGDDDDDDDDDDDRGPENLFTGGERSGLSVQNPDLRRGRNQPDAVKEILRQAAQNARGRGPGGFPGEGGPGDDEGAIAPSAGAAASSFGGAGRTIGDDGPAATQTPATGSTPQQAAAAGGDDEDFDPVAIRHLNFWQDGFSIEDGPLQRYEDPQSQALLQAIENQSAPPGAFNIKFGQRVELRVAKRLNEKYSPPAPGPMKAFGGEGNRLGSPAPAMGATSSTSATPAAAPPSTGTSAPSNFTVDSSAPTTSVQIRLADGTRLVGRFNHTHTVADIRSFINASQPGMAARSYALQTSFPPKPVEDEAQTIKEAGLLNAVVQQKWT